MEKKTNTHILYISVLIAASFILLGSCTTLEKPAQEPPAEAVQQPQEIELESQIQE